MNLGQIYTKKIIADFMVNLFSLPKGKILDPCFGGGVFIDSLISGTYHDVTGIEIDPEAYSRYVNPAPRRCRLTKGDFFSTAIKGCSGIIMNPPYVRQEEIEAMAPLGVTKQSISSACAPLDIPSKSNLYIYFLLKGAQILPPKGEMIAIFPDTWRNTPDGLKFEQLLTSMGSIETHFKIAGEPFEGNPLVDVCIIKFVKGIKCDTSFYNLTIKGDRMKIEEGQRNDLDFSTGTRLTDIADIRRGITTGANRIFINPAIGDRRHLHKIISTPKSVNGFTTSESIRDSILVLDYGSRLSDEEKEYLDSQKNEVMAQEKKKTLKRLIEKDECWYRIQLQSPGDIVFSYIIRENMKFILNDAGENVRDNFYSIKSPYDSRLLFALLNNYYIYAQLEDRGKKYGNGLLKIQVYDLNNVFIPHPDTITPAHVRQLKEEAAGLAETGDMMHIDRITEILHRYYNTNPEIREYYLSRKNHRLGK